MKKAGKYILIVFSGIFLIIVMILLATQTTFFKNKVKKVLLSTLEKQLIVTASIDKIEGNFYSNLTLKNIELNQNDSSFIKIPEIRLTYNIWELKSRVISVDSMVILQPEFNLWQQNDSSWNISALTKPKDAPKAKKPFNFKIDVKHLSISNGSISVSSNSSVIPQQTRNFNLLVNGLYSEEEIKIDLQNFSFNTQNPDFVLNKLSGTYAANESGIQLDSLLLISAGSNIDLNGQFSSLKDTDSKLISSRIDNNELTIFVPGFKLLCSPAVNVSFVSADNLVTAHAELQHNNQSLKARVSFSSLEHLLSKKVNVPYSADLSFQKFIIHDWINIKAIEALIDGNVELEGANLLNPKSNLSIVANLENSKYYDIAFDTLAFNGIYNNDSINARLDITSDYGEVHVNGMLNNISGTPGYKANIQSSEFDLTAFIPKMKGTKINGSILVEGSSFDLQNILAHTTLNLNNSSIYQFPINSLHTSIRMEKKDIGIDSLNLIVPGANIIGNGSLSLDSLYLKTALVGELNSLQVLDSLIQLPVQFDSVFTTTTIEGPVQNLEIVGNIAALNTIAYDIETEHIEGKYSITLEKDSLNLWVNAAALSVQTGPVSWDTTLVDFNYNNKIINIDAHAVWNDTISANVTTNIIVGDTMLFEVPRFEASTLISDYYFTDTVKVFLVQNEKISIENFLLKDHNREDFACSANGSISIYDSTDFQLRINRLDLEQLNQLIKTNDSLQGFFTTNISLAGTAQNPSINGNFSVLNPEYGIYSVNNIQSEFNYHNQVGFAKVSTTDKGNTIYADISSPFTLYTDSLQLNYTIPDSFDASLVLDSIQVSTYMNQLVHTDSLSGIINGQIRATGQINNPQFYGNIDFEEGHFSDKNLGVEYNQIQASLSFDGKQIYIDTALIQQEEGLMSIAGNIEFDSTLIKGNIKSSALQLDANNFFITQHRNYEVLINANNFIQTNNKKPEYGGKIKVIRSDIYLPAFIKDNRTDIEKDIPMLLEAVQTTQDSVLPEENFIGLNEKIEDRENEFLNNLTGKLNIEIPRNTWVKTDDMRLELSGDLEIVKTGSYFEVFGNVDVIRGQYILYGKKLNIKESQIIFQGGEDPDPVLSITAEYIYRSSDKEKRYLELLITGEVSEPQIDFFLDGAEITETDGVSVLIFGATSDEIGYSGQNGMVGSMSSSAVASIVSSQLNKTVGNQLNLDMIELTSTENWQSAALVVGKYITNDIFITYQRGFGEVEDDEITPEIVTAEYEINDKLFLRLESGSSRTSGIDIVLKFEQNKDKKQQIGKPRE